MSFSIFKHKESIGYFNATTYAKIHNKVEIASHSLCLDFCRDNKDFLVKTTDLNFKQLYFSEDHNPLHASWAAIYPATQSRWNYSNGTVCQRRRSGASKDLLVEDYDTGFNVFITLTSLRI